MPLQKILDQDKATNRTLTELARTRSNQEALDEPAIPGTEPFVAVPALSDRWRIKPTPQPKAGY